MVFPLIIDSCFVGFGTLARDGLLLRNVTAFSSSLGDLNVSDVDPDSLLRPTARRHVEDRANIIRHFGELCSIA
eukprot:9478076-Pyramimonas_sp.AAC.1